MARRHRMSNSHSRRSFQKGAANVDRRNISSVTPYVSRGGARL